jgi:gas vesicle protein
MSDLDRNTKNILLGTLIGSAVGASLIILLKSSSHKGRKNTLHFIGKALANAGDVIRDQLEDPQALLKTIDKKIAKNEDKLADILELTAAGIQLWKKLAK